MSRMHTALVPGFRIRNAVPEDMERVGEIARQAWQRIHDSTAGIMGREMHAVLCENWEAEKTVAVHGHWNRHPDWFRVIERVETARVVAFLTFSIDRGEVPG